MPLTGLDTAFGAHPLTCIVSLLRRFDLGVFALDQMDFRRYAARSEMRRNSGTKRWFCQPWLPSSRGWRTSALQVLADKCDLVSIGTVALPLMPRRDRVIPW